LVFETKGDAGRAIMIHDWKAFIEGPWRTVVAPHLLQSWRAAHAGNVPALLASSERLDLALHDLGGDAEYRSLAAGEILLRSTRGAKYPGVLGQLRQQADTEGAEIHLATVWAAVAVVFQLPVADVVAEYLRQEWTTATGRYAHHADPQGLLSYAAVAHRTLKERFFPASDGNG
jgi:urease accessory protein UreF